jgi:hypothetical protein
MVIPISIGGVILYRDEHVYLIGQPPASDWHDVVADRQACQVENQLNRTLVSGLRNSNLPAGIPCSGQSPRDYHWQTRTNGLITVTLKGWNSNVVVFCTHVSHRDWCLASLGVTRVATNLRVGIPSPPLQRVIITRRTSS